MLENSDYFVCWGYVYMQYNKLSWSKKTYDFRCWPFICTLDLPARKFGVAIIVLWIGITYLYKKKKQESQSFSKKYIQRGKIIRINFELKIPQLNHTWSCPWFFFFNKPLIVFLIFPKKLTWPKNQYIKFNIGYSKNWVLGTYLVILTKSD